MTIGEKIANLRSAAHISQEQLAEDEDILAVSKRLIAKNRHAYEELAK